MEIDSAELLEEMLRRGEQSVFPLLQKSVDRFVDVFNHDRIQQKFKEKVQKVRNAAENCYKAETLHDKLRNLKEVLDEFQKKGKEVDQMELCSELYSSGLFGIINEGKLDFLTRDDLDILERVDAFLKLLEDEESKSDAKKNINAAFEEYLNAWKINKRAAKWTEDSINQAEIDMRAEFDRGESLNTGELKANLDELMDEIKRQFEPLRERLVGVAAKINTTRNALNAIFPLGDALMSGVEGIGGPRAKRATRPNWFDDTSRFITDYLRGKKTDGELRDFIETEKLEPDLCYFHDRLNPWLKELIEKIGETEDLSQKSYVIQKDVILKEIERMKKFLYAVVLNKPEMLSEHQRILEEMIQDAASLNQLSQNASILPFVSFGQLPLPEDRSQRLVIMQFVLDESVSHQSLNDIMGQLEKLFENVQKCDKSVKNGVNIVELSIQLDDNIPATIARFISKLSDLHVRGILVGEFGLGGFRNAMNPAYNRIYSLNAVDQAVNFIPTYFYGSLDRGGEPYYCPNGWRRYAIDVGMTGTEFENKYGKWHVAYHGTEGHVAMAILLNGIRASGQGMFLNQDEGAVYISPSIEYSGHPRYSRVWKVKEMYVQMVLQIRVNGNLVFEKHEGTLAGAWSYDPQMDANFMNNELEWVIKWPPGTMISALNGILVYGIMLRVSTEHPGKLPQNAWWEKSRQEKSLPEHWEYF